MPCLQLHLSRVVCADKAWRLCALLLAGCSGQLEGVSGPAGFGADGDPASPGPGQAGAALCADAEPEVGPSVLRRLSNLELQLTLQDLFQLPSPPELAALPPDNDKDGFKTFADVQTLSAQHLRAYLDNARLLADALLADDARRAAVVGCEPGSQGCLRSFLERFGKLAYRRPLATDELAELASRAEVNALDVTDQIRYAIQALLASPDFLYRIEVGDTPDGLTRLTSYELATRLSFALWGRAPDSQLLAEAERGALDSDEGLRTIAARLLTDTRASYFYGKFFRQWLGYETLRAPNVAPQGWSDALLPELQAEADAVLARYAFGTASFLDVLISNETWLSPELASFYGLPAPAADGQLTIPATHPRAHSGILGHAALLSLKSDGDPVALRGNWLRETFFCSALRIPPEVAAELGDLLVGLSPLQIVEKRNTEQSCKGCHGLIDPIGVGLASFDATGRWDPAVDITEYGIEPRLPDLPSGEFDSLASLAEKLRAAPEVAACLSQKVFLYVGGRSPSSDDQCAVQGAHAAFSEAGSFESLLAGLVAAPSFRLRRAAEPSATEAE